MSQPKLGKVRINRANSRLHKFTHKCMLNVFRNIQLLFLISVMFWKTFQHDKNHKLLIMFTLHFGFG